MDTQWEEAFKCMAGKLTKLNIEHEQSKKKEKIKGVNKMKFINKEQLIEKLREKAKFNKKEFTKATAGADIVHHRAKWMALQEAIEACKSCDEKEFTEDIPVKTDGIVRPTNKIQINREDEYHITFKLNDVPIDCDTMIKTICPGLGKYAFPFSVFTHNEIKLTHDFVTSEIKFDTVLNCRYGTPDEINAAFKERIQKIKEWYGNNKEVVFELEI